MVAAALPLPDQHLDALSEALCSVRTDLPILSRWGRRLAEVLDGGGRLLVAGNGGSAAEAQHLAAELVGRYRDDRVGYSAIPLHADTSTFTAILNDYGPDEVFARQVRAHGEPGDVLVLLSTSGRSRNILAAAGQGRQSRLTVWAMTGAVPNPLAALAHDVFAVSAASTATVQEVHLLALHIVCSEFDRALARTSSVEVRV